jgi:hypothetical protein
MSAGNFDTPRQSGITLTTMKTATATKDNSGCEAGGTGGVIGTVSTAFAPL